MMTPRTRRSPGTEAPGHLETTTATSISSQPPRTSGRAELFQEHHADLGLFDSTPAGGDE